MIFEGIVEANRSHYRGQSKFNEKLSGAHLSFAESSEPGKALNIKLRYIAVVECYHTL